MKVAVIALIATLSVAYAVPSVTLTSWLEYKAQHNKVYANAEEELLRFKIFSDNIEKINKHNKLYNAGLKTYKMAINKFADMTHQEFKQYLSLSGPVPELDVTGIYERPVGVRLPASVDWRKQGVVNPVKDQAQCGSCWAFSTVGSLESNNKLHGDGQLRSLSEQQLVDCSGSAGNMGCGGGWMDWAYNYIQQYGIESEATYPYTAEDGTCQYDKSKVVVTIKGHTMIKSGSEADLQAAVANVGPVAVAVDASEWQFYSGGIFSTDDFEGLDHGVVTVGYGTESGQDYWIVRNSWGPNWGESGYIRVARNKNNMIGITDRACYPNL